MADNIFDFIKEEETRYGQEIEVMENWHWGMKEHIRTSILMKHGKFSKATNQLDTKNPYKNIIYPLLNLRYRAEDIDMKDVALYADDPAKHHLSFLVKKYHDEVYVREHDLDTFLDETKEEKIDLGGTLVRKGAEGPVQEPLESIAFCDQTDILSGPIGFKMFFSPDELYETEALGWGNTDNGATTTLDELIVLAEAAKKQDANKGDKTKTPGKYIEVYRVHGSLPASYLSGTANPEKYFRQLHVVAFYKSDKSLDSGVTLYKKREYVNPFKLHLSGKKIRNRALAYGGVEELFDPQIWTNYSEIRKKELLDAVSKIIRWTDDDALINRNKINDMENNEMLVVQKGSQVGVLRNDAPNVQLFNESLQEWNMQAQSTSGATDALMGKNPTSGSPFKLQDLVVQQGQGLHDYRRGKYATFVAEIYTDWIIPDIAKKVTQGARFLATLSPDELEYVSDCLVRNTVATENNERVLSGQLPMTDEEKAQYEQKVRDDFGRKGNKHFIDILKGEFKDVPLKVKVNVAGKQKDLAGTVGKLTNVLRFVFSTYNPQTGTFAALEDPKAAKVFNKLIEYSGLDPIDFGYTSAKPMPQPDPTQNTMPTALPAKTPALV